MNLFTTVHIATKSTKIDYHDRILMIGSCFSKNMAVKLQEHYFQVLCNPFGELYNPVSIANCLKRIASGELFQEDELVFHDGLYHSMSHHGDFSHETPQETLQHINEALRQAREFIKNTSVVIITLGSAFVYEKDGEIVGNCHKLPEKSFSRYRLSVEQTVAAIREINAIIGTISSECKVIYTVSPIRHIKDGLHENQLSKATLQLAIANTQSDYFPAYEIVMDELRDYRYYDEDMVHPNKIAVNYIWEKFVETYLSQDTQIKMKPLHQLYLDEHHTLLHPDSNAAKTFLAQTQAKHSQLKEQYPWI